MLRVFMFVLMLVGVSTASYAQLGKIQFEDAERAYSEGKFEEALQLLSDAEQSLGKINAPILHLRILARAEVIKKDVYKDYDIIDNLRKETNLFLAEYDKDERLADKYRDVYGVSKLLKDLPLTRQQFEDAIRTRKEEALKAEQESRNRQIILENNRTYVAELYERYSPYFSNTDVYPMTYWDRNEAKAKDFYHKIRDGLLKNIDPAYITHQPEIPRIRAEVPGAKRILAYSIERDGKRTRMVITFK